MGDSFSWTLSDYSSILETQYFPPIIELSPNKNYASGLVKFSTSNATPNVDIIQNKFHGGKEEITVTTGSYKIGDIHWYLQHVWKKLWNSYWNQW